MKGFHRIAVLRRGSSLLALVGGAIPILLAVGLGCHREAKGPIVIYLIDTLRPDRLPVYGARRDTSPAASSLAREALTFSNAFSVSSWTRPSVATLFTSALPSQVDALNRYGRLRDSIPTLPALLRDRGWQTAAFVTNGNIFDGRVGFRRGFDLFVPISGPTKPKAREAVDPAVRYIETQKSARFFLYVHVIDPHRTYYLEPAYQALFPEARASGSSREGLLADYDRAIRQADDQFQRLVTALQRRGWWRDATVIYTSDHGEEFLEHGGLGHGSSLYEEQVRVPLIVKYPGAKNGGTRRSDLVTLADVTPTIAELAGISASQAWIGSSLLHTMPADRGIYYTEELDSMRVYALRRGQRKLVIQLYPKFQRAFYDLAADPAEQKGLLIACDGRLPAASQDLARSLDEWHRRDIGAYPSLTLEKVADAALTLDLKVNLASTPNPFLTAEDYCRFAPLTAGAALQVHQQIGKTEPFRLQLATSSRGDFPVIELTVSSAADHRPLEISQADSPLRVVRTEAHFISGPPTDDLLKHLRSLGYLAAGGE